MNYAIITENDESNWDDKTGVSYNYPTKYSNILIPGTHVIYYKGKLKNDKYSSRRLSDHPHYFGVAVIGESYLDSKAKKKEYYCDIKQYHPFDLAVHFKFKDKYIEIIPESKASNYWRDGVRLIDRDIYEKILKIADINFESWNVTEPDTKKEKPLSARLVQPVNNQQTKQRTLPSESDNDTSPNFLEIQKKKQIKGQQAEAYVIRYEKERLLASGRPDLSEKVEDYSNRFSMGFDVLSFDENGTERQIEVKASINNGFIITRNELNKSSINPNYWIYIVNVKMDGVEIKQLRNPDLNDQNKFRLDPKDYFVSFSIES